MASKQDSPQNSEQHKLNRFLFLKMKTAVAVAIIKSKPEGMSGREFSEKLALNLRERNENWKKRAEDLQSEVLSLKQELLLRRRNTHEPEKTTEVKDAVEQEIFSEDLFGPNKDTERLTESDSETPDLLMDISTNTYVQPTNSANTTATTKTTSSTAVSTAPAASVFRETPVQLPHVEFLQALCGLQPFSCPRSDPLVFGLASEVGPVLEESVSQLLRSIWATFRASEPSPAGAPGSARATPDGGVSPSRAALLYACQVSASTLEVYCSSRTPSLPFTQTLEELMEGLTQTLLSCEDQPHDSLSDCVLTLARSRLLRCSLIRQIISKLRDITEQLWTLHQTPDPDLCHFPLVEFGNSCRLMWLLELLLPSSNSNTPIRDRQKSDQPMRLDSNLNGPITVDLSSVQDSLEDLQRRVFPLSQEFPLFCVCLWRVLGLIRTQGE